ncbi:MAG TPA: PAS domain S-box protein [Rhodanobacteraceae bacterium]|jgi:diguanylate cyclase (GGDEF)-like protein/PAS domain S-box-containing protein|nr:PAS domain S-box protein [Rhodanobacteraceae bacterium]
MQSFDMPDGQAASRGGLWLLMVEDQRFDAMLLRKQLAAPAVGCSHVDHAETLAGALEALRQCAYDAVLLDLGLSDSDGVAAVRTMRARFPEAVVVVLTGRDEEQLGLEAMASGAQDMLVKGSFDTDMLARALHYAIERQRLEGSLRQSVEEHRTLFENNPFPVWVYDAFTLRFLAVNEATVHEYGYSRDEFLKMTLLDIQPPEEAKRLIASVEANKEVRLVVEDWRHRRRNGSVFDVEINAQSIDFRGRQARIVLARDITLRKRAIRALEVSEGRFRKLFQYSLGLICTHDLDGVLLSVNPAAARALDFSIGDLMGRNLADMMPPERRGDCAAYLRRIIAKGIDSGMLVVMARDGTERVWQYHNVLDNDADEPYVLGHAQDITDRRNYEHRLREQSTIDPLTGCRNRRFLDEHAARLGESSWACILIDLDRFKQINDTYGHERGDQVLIGMAEFLRAHAPKDSVVVRMGGDEFLLMLDHADESSTAELADQLRVQAPARAPSEFTSGWAVRKGNETIEATIRCADQGLYSTRAAVRGGTSHPSSDQ